MIFKHKKNNFFCFFRDYCLFKNYKNCKQKTKKIPANSELVKDKKFKIFLCFELEVYTAQK
jgi:hypothetical protein